MLQTRSGKRTAAAAVKIAVDMVDEGSSRRKTRSTRSSRRTSTSCCAPSSTRRRAREGTRIGNGPQRRRPARPSARRSSTPTRQRSRAGRRRDRSSRPHRDRPDDFHGMAVAAGRPDRPRRATSHAAVVARRSASRASPARASSRSTTRRARVLGRRQTVREGDGSSSTARPARSFSALSRRSRSASRTRRSCRDAGLGRRVPTPEVWTNADNPEDAARPASYGAQGIGLCRTEHMFCEEERLPIVRDGSSRVRGDASQGPRRPRRRARARRERVATSTRRWRSLSAPAGRLRGHLRGDGRAAGHRSA